MSTDIQTAIEAANENWQAEGEWIVISDEEQNNILASTTIVCVVHSKGGGLDEDIEFAMRDPARVLKVSAYPKVVEAMEKADKKSYRGVDSNGSIIVIPWDNWVAILAALSTAHPETAKEGASK